MVGVELFVVGRPGVNYGEEVSLAKLLMVKNVHYLVALSL